MKSAFRLAAVRTASNVAERSAVDRLDRLIASLRAETDDATEVDRKRIRARIAARLGEGGGEPW